MSEHTGWEAPVVGYDVGAGVHACTHCPTPSNLRITAIRTHFDHVPYPVRCAACGRRWHRLLDMWVRDPNLTVMEESLAEFQP